MNLSFEDRVVVVTGGGGALGSAVVKQVVDAGGRCVVPVYNDAELERAEWAGDDRVRTMTNVNLCDDDRLVEFFDFAAQEPLWASIHIVGGFAMAPIVETSNADLRKQLEMNTVSAFGSVREAKRRMPKGGRIVNVAARLALFAELASGMAAYAASKAAVAAITQAAAEEFWKDGVLVNAVVPGTLDTPSNRDAMPGADRSGWASLDAAAATIVFLASPQNRATRGGLVPVYGGG